MLALLFSLVPSRLRTLKGSLALDARSCRDKTRLLFGKLALGLTRRSGHLSIHLIKSS